MTAHRTFEALPVWQDARALCRAIYAVTRQPPFRRDRGLCDQVQRASVSILSNIAEGMERGTNDELIAFLFYAKGSAGEVRAQLYVAEDQEYLPAAEAERLRAAASSVSRQLSGWIKSLQTPDVAPGPRFHKEPSAADKRWEELRRRFLANPPWKRQAEDGRGKREDERSPAP